MILLIAISLWNIVHAFMMLFPHSYVGELMVSFLPYSITGHFLISLILSIGILRFKTKKTIRWFILLLASTLFLGSYQYLDYQEVYQPIRPSIGDKNPNQSLSFLYANIYYKNNNFSGLLTTIQQTNPDMILLVEYAKKHDDALSTILKKEYPYRNRYVGGKHFDGDIVYSRYPLSKIDHEMPLGSRSFSHVQVQKLPGSPLLDIALVHTSAPVSDSFFAMRQQQMDKLYNILSEYYTGDALSKRNLIVLGDFNISPWSIDYKKFDKEMKQLSLQDITTDLTKTSYKTPFPYTRCHQILGVACSHIDHIRTNNNTITLERIDIPGSDHDGFIGKR